MNKPTHFLPLYMQVKELLIQRLIDKVWLPGSPLPSEFQLADELQVSQGTVRKALDELAAEKLVVRRQGKGTYVAEHTQEQPLYHFFRLVDLQGKRHLPESTILDFNRYPATLLESESLDLSDEEQVIRITRTRALEGVPVIYETISLPEKLFANMPLTDELPNTLYSFYQREFGLSVVKVIEKLRAVLSNEIEETHLEIKTGTPLLEAKRVAYALNGEAVELRVTRCHTDQHSYLNELS
ncbi:GntR family transcriptional regulator [Vibrio penaeicida]|uniref:GntR family transcriptional regulator n=1 Tax=Vibrio penaeicida TaxID=104609 RepID=UPI00273770A1|nr:GntR family transcriptional regulator [Vibrio penaeicida]MDP2574342.1 GntR family transcriptional regulator [Vibrio penaeicida]